MENRVQIVGIGDDGIDGLSQPAQEVIRSADVLFGPPKTLEMLREVSAETVAISDGFEKVVERIESRGSAKLAILTMGDPLFYGTARFLFDKFGKQEFEIIPHVSIMQLAFARLKESWDEAYLTNLGTQPLPKVLDRIRLAEKVGLFTTDDASPSFIAKKLLERKLDYFDAFVCENLGSPDERVTSGSLAEIAEQSFSSLNVMILVRQPEIPDQPRVASSFRLFGNPDDAFLHSQPKRGLLTPAEVRCVALAEMNLGHANTVWDVGAGSGSVAIEAAQLAQDSQVYAIEMDIEDHRLIQENVERFGVTNLVPVLGEAPRAWQDLPSPDAVFVGGSGRMVPSIVESAFAKLNQHGRIVINVATIDNLQLVQQLLEKQAEDCEVTMIQLGRGVRQLELLRFESVNPTFLITATKP